MTNTNIFKRFTMLSFVIFLFVIILYSCNEKGTAVYDNIKLYKETYKPQSMTNMISMSMTGTKLFAADESQIIMYDISNGEEKNVCSGQSGISIICVKDDEVYAYCDDSNSVKVWNVNDLSESSIDVSKAAQILNRISKMTVTDNYIVLYGQEPETNHLVIVRVDKQSLESVKIDFDNTLVLRCIAYCHDDTIGLYFEGYSSGENYIQKYNIRTQTESSDKIYSGLQINFLSYNKDDASFYVCESTGALNVTNIKKIIVKDNDVSVVKVAHTELNSNVIISGIAVENNVAVWYDTRSATVYMKYISETDGTLVICLDSYASEALEYMCNIFSVKYDIDVRIVAYNSIGKVKLKLLANENDFDIFQPNYYQIDEYVNAKTYENLLKYPEMSEAIQKNINLITLLAINDGEMFGIPFDIEQSEIRPSQRQDSVRKEINIKTYLFSTLDLIKGTYTDTSGEEIAKMLEFVLNDQNNEAASTYIPNKNNIKCDYMLINPYSKNKDTAALFLTEFVKVLSGESEVEYASDQFTPDELKARWNTYPEEDSCDGVYATYRSVKSETYIIVGDAYDAVLSGTMTVADGVKEVVSKLKMIVGE